MAFHYEFPVRFGDVDHAGIVYYPRFFHYTHIAFEELFGEGEYRRMLQDRKLGFPTVSAQCDFKRPFRYGDKVAVAVTLDRLGTTSVTLRYVLSRAGDTGGSCAEARITTALIDLSTFQSVTIPPDFREMFSKLT